MHHITGREPRRFDDLIIWAGMIVLGAYIIFVYHPLTWLEKARQRSR